MEGTTKMGRILQSLPHKRFLEQPHLPAIHFHFTEDVKFLQV